MQRSFRPSPRRAFPASLTRKPLCGLLAGLFALPLPAAALSGMALVLPNPPQTLQSEPVPAMELEPQLRTQKRLIPDLLEKAKLDPHPVFIFAERLEGRNEAATVAEGDAELRKIDAQLYADKIIYRPLDDVVEARGPLRLERGQDVITGDALYLKLTDQVGYIEHPHYTIRRETSLRYSGQPTGAVTIGPIFDSPLAQRKTTTGYGQAERIDFEGDNQVHITAGTYSTCKPDSSDWYARSDDIRLDFDAERGEAKDGTLYFKDVPILYAPSFTFPLNNRRTSGLLAPTYATSNKTGLDLTLPFYWNIAPNYDATLGVREMSKRGLQLSTDFRYKDFHYDGNLRLEYLPHDQQTSTDRFAYSYAHQHRLGQGVTGTINWSGVSDDQYWTDLSSRLIQTSQTQMPREMRLSYFDSSNWWWGDVQTLRYQTLQTDSNNLVLKPYSLAPRINFNARLPTGEMTEVGMMGQFTAFTHPTLVQGQRLVLYPQFSLPLETAAFHLTPKLGLHLSEYNLTQQGALPASQSRNVPIFSLDTGLVFERPLEWQGQNYTQTLEPRLYYLYVPYRDQSNIPVFDTAAADFNFAQIFNENRYIGNDRIGDANQLTAAATSRLLDPATGAERARFLLGQRYYFSGQKVLLPGETARGDNYSHTLMAANAEVLRRTYLDAAWEYDWQQNRTQRFALGTRYQPEAGRVLSASYRQLSNEVEQFDFAGQWPLSSRWYAVGRYNYSLRGKQLVEGIGGLEYNAGCWVVRAVAQRLEVATGSPSKTLFLQLELNDFAAIGSNPIQLLRRSIPGYGRINALSEGSLLSSE
ncbi:MAG: hypothetical protein RIR00_1097 [Pseudomonadota bacterium]